MINNFQIISGPCSAESEEQLFSTAKILKELINPDYFRAGLWKPRTNPNSFEGIGEVGISYLKDIQQKLNMKVITEISSLKQLNLILKNGIDAFWIGARSVTNPFLIKEIIENTENTKEIFIKNPIFPDIELWAGVIQRFKNAGFENITAIHRGFFPNEKTKYRNMPMWNIVIDLKTRFPDLKILCDPSHIAGNTNFIQEICQQAINRNLNGLMIESHYKPENSLSDKNQQLKPIELKQILDKLVFKTQLSKNENFENEISLIREQIDMLDYQIIDILNKRLGLVSDISKLKKENNVCSFQPTRWKNILKSRLSYSKKYNLSEIFIEKILKLIHEESILKQDKE